MLEISKQQILDRIRVENPWWDNQGSIDPDISKMEKRSYFSLLYPLVKDTSIRRAVVLMGPRRVGKTILLHQIIQALIDTGIKPKQICYLTIETPLYSGLGLEQLLHLYQEAAKINKDQPCYVFFDEIQYLKGWEVHLKALVDTFKNVKCTVSGSAAAALKLKSKESGAGRFTDFLLPPLTFYEYLKLSGHSELITINEKEGSVKNSLYWESDESLCKHFLNYINFGGYPESIFNKQIQADPGRFIRSDIIDKVLLKDLPSLYGINDIQELNRLFTMLAYNTGNEVSLQGLSQNSGVAKNTIKKYIEYLETAFLIKKVQRIDQDARGFQTERSFKVYLTNPSMYAALFAPVKDEDKNTGHLVETAIWAQRFHEMSPLYYARWKKGEIDIVRLDAAQKPIEVIEVKWSDRPIEREPWLKTVLEFAKKHHLSRVVITSKTKMKTSLIDGVGIFIAPSAIWCYLTGLIALGERFNSADWIFKD